MLIENGFEVAASPEAAWALLVDVPRVVPCMPGATLERTVDDTTWEVLQRVKLGPISLQFRSEVRRTELDPAARRATLTIKAREVRGRGGAEATIRSALSTVDGGTRVDIATELDAPGRCRAVRTPRRRQRRRGADAAVRGVPRLDARERRERRRRRRHPCEAKPVGGIRLFFRALWAKLFRRS